MEAVRLVRQKLVPNGYQPYPFIRKTPETFLHCLRSLVATFLFRHAVQKLKSDGVEFSLYLYVPEIDPITNEVRHDRGDQNHVFKRIATSTRNGNCEELDYAAFDAVLCDGKSGLTHVALISERKQSLLDAERLLSYHVVKSLRRQGYETEAQYVEIIVNWHNAADGRGLNQLQRCKYNYEMLNYILEKWMPWYKDSYDFSMIDINRLVSNISDNQSAIAVKSVC